MKALVTGACGFIGGHLVEALLRRDYEVHCLIRKESNVRSLKNQKVELCLGSYEDKSSLISAVRGKNYVFHLGAAINAPNWPAFYKVNTLGTMNLIAAAAEANPGLKRFVFVSSIAASGPSKRGSFKSENDRCRPITFYGKSKLLAEQTINQYRHLIPAVIIRLPNVLGVREQKVLTVLKFVKNRIFPLLGNGEKQTSLCFVEDAVQALILAAEKSQASGQTYFVTDDRAYSWRELVACFARYLEVDGLVLKLHHWKLLALAGVSEIVAKLINAPALVSMHEILATRNYYWLYDSRKIESELGFRPAVNFEEGIKAIVCWYKEKGLL
jgi:dihydroflavonol-4-reductase